jgi:hypothetical protein
MHSPDDTAYTGPGSPTNYSMDEIKTAVGVPRIHNMVRMTFDSSYRRRRLRASRTQDPDALDLHLAQPHPGRSGKGSEELTVGARVRKGREKVGRDAERSRSRQRKGEEERRRSIEEVRRKKAKGELPERGRIESVRAATAVPQLS